ncbi:MAG: NAD(+)/NADH kinase [Lachnospiraceae bacterium]|nr:NAD(+)/NADH kinase [Lachnospiraceae bacterium]
MESFLLITNNQKDKDLSVTNSICDYLIGKKGKAVKTYIPENRDYDISADKLEGVDCVLVLGGDGTILRVAKKIVKSGLPIVGVNMGHIGYLADVDKDNVFSALDALCEGKFTTENRMMLSGKVIRDESVLCDWDALNDIVITRGGSMQILNFEVLVNGKMLKAYRADGLILATPTGSTAYNLSSGGPIVEPGADMTLVTPIAPHTMLSRSIILKAEDEIEVKILPPHDLNVEQLIEVYFDGIERLKLEVGDKVVVTKSDMTTTLVRISDAGFLETLYEKMREG